MRRCYDRWLWVPWLWLGWALSAHAAELGQRLLDGYIHPVTTQLHTATVALDSALAAYCAQPADTALRAATEQRFAALVEAWAPVEVLRFGPVIEDNRLERFFFYPDPRGVLLRQLQALLAAADPALLDAGALAARSVAVQGLPALEYALYGGDAAAEIAADQPAGRYRCGYARAVSGNLRVLAGQIAAGWAEQGVWAREFAAPSATGTVYRSSGEVATEALKAMSTALQSARDVKLLPALGADLEQARGQRAPLWRSASTQRLLASTLNAVRLLYQAAGFSEMLPERERWIGDSLVSESQVGIEDLRAVRLGLDQAVLDPDSRQRLLHAALVIKNQQALVVEYLAPALGVNLGFNALDGD